MSNGKEIDLLEIKKCNSKSCKGNIVFIHGLTGHSIETWHPEGKNDKDNCWLSWLAKKPEFNDIGVWSVDYDASLMGSSRSPYEQAQIILERLNDERLISDKKFLFFVAYSLGGIYCLYLLKYAQDTNTIDNFTSKTFSEQTKGLIFLGTPFNTSTIPKIINNVGFVNKIVEWFKIFINPSTNVEVLENKRSDLTQLTNWFENQDNRKKSNIKLVKCFCKTLPMNDIMIVDRDSASPGIPGIKAIKIDKKNHVDLAKPHSKKDQIFIKIKTAIIDFLEIVERSVIQKNKEIQKVYESKNISIINEKSRPDYVKLYNNLGIKNEDYRTFTPGREFYGIWEWLKRKYVLDKSLDKLLNALTKLGHQFSDLSRFQDIPKGDLKTLNDYLFCELKMRTSKAVFIFCVHKTMKIGDAAEHLVKQLLPHLLNEDYEWSLTYDDENKTTVPSNLTFVTADINSGDTVYLYGNHRTPEIYPYIPAGFC